MKNLNEKNDLTAAVGDCLLTTREVATLVGMTPNALAVDLCRGRFPIAPIKLGSRNRFRLSDVRNFIAGPGDQAAAR